MCNCYTFNVCVLYFCFVLFFCFFFVFFFLFCLVKAPRTVREAIEEMNCNSLRISIRQISKLFLLTPVCMVILKGVIVCSLV